MQKKNLLLIFTILTAQVCLQAQITVTNATFPVAGDSLKTATALNPEIVSITPPGGPTNWDFSALTPASRQVTVYQAASNGTASASFPNAELVTIGELGAETYFDVSASVFATLGFSGADLAGGFPIMTNVVITPPLPELQAPLNFLSLFNSASNANIAFPTSALPGGVLDSLGIPSDLLDSIRIRLSIQRLELVNAYGSLSIPGGTYNVLREKRIDYTSTAIEVHTILGWIDIGSLGFPLEGIGTDTTVTYSFISNTAKEPIAVVTLDASESFFIQVDYKDNGIPSAVDHVVREGAQVVISPNPVFDEATIELKDFVPGLYTLRLFDTKGQSILVKEITVDHEPLYLQSLTSGTYLYHVTDEKNQIMASGKLLKINP